MSGSTQVQLMKKETDRLADLVRSLESNGKVKSCIAYDGLGSLRDIITNLRYVERKVRMNKCQKALKTMLVFNLWIQNR